MKTPHLKIKASLLLGLTAALPLTAATFPYTNDFSGTGANLAFSTEVTDAEWALNSGSYRNTYSNSTITPSIATIPITGVSGQSFLMESQFTVAQTGTINVNGATSGFGFFASSSTFSTSGNSYYLADFKYGSTGSGVGTLRILSLGDSAGFTATDSSADDNAGSADLAIVVGTTYTLRLEGSYAGSTLNMSLGLYDAAGTSQIGGTAIGSDTSPLTGTNFGYRNRIGIGGGTSIINFDNYSVTAVPEPAHWAMLFSGLLGTLALYRRKRQG